MSTDPTPTPAIPSESPSLREGLGWASSDSQLQAPGVEAKNPEAPTPSFAPSPFALSPSQADSLAEALTTTTPHADIAAQHNLTIAQLSTLAKSPLLAEKIAAISALHALRDAAIIREQISKLRDIANTTDSPIEARRASTTIIRHSAIMARIAAGHNKRAPANLRSTSGSAKPLPEGAVGVGEYDTITQAAEAFSSASDSSSSSGSSSSQLSNLKSPSPDSPSVALSHHRTVALPPPAPKPYSTPELLFVHQINQLRAHQPKNCNEAFNALYDYIDHPIKCITSLQPRLKSRIDFSMILHHYNADYEDLGPATMDQEVVTPAPISPDLSLKPVLKYFAIKRYAFQREGQTPLYLRVHFAKQEPLRGETTDRWGLSDLAIDSP